MSYPDEALSNSASPSNTLHGSGSDGAGAAFNFAGQIRKHTATLLDQGMSKVSEYADTGKQQAAAKLNDVAGVITSIAETVEKSYGATAGQYVRSASTTVGSFADDLKSKSVSDLISASRAAIGNNAGVAITTAAVLGFAAARIAKGGQGQQGQGNRSDPKRTHQSAALGAIV